MRVLCLMVAIIALVAFPLMGQEKNLVLEGDWEGILKVGSASLRIIFHIASAQGRYTATMDSPDQGARGIPVSAVRLDGSSVVLEVASIGGSYTGSVDASFSKIEGKWKQSGMAFPLVLNKSKKEAQAQQNTPELQDAPALQGAPAPQPQNQSVQVSQEPTPPFPYTAKDVEFINEKAGIVLAGTLTVPNGAGPFPAAALVSGSGPQNRDEEILGHKPFLVLADYLTRRGIAVLRYDDRGVGLSKGDFQSATTFDFADDAEAALEFLARQPGIDAHRLGVIGHSEGAIIASMLGVRNPDVAFIVMLAGPGIRGDALLLMQNTALGRASGLSEAQIAQANELNRRLYDIALEDGDAAILQKKILDVLENAIDTAEELTQEQKTAQKEKASLIAAQLVSPWMRSFFAIDPSEYLKQMRIPVLALNGSKDLQVPASENLAAIRAALESAGNRSATVVELDGLNHLFQHATTGLPSEYGEIKETFAPEALALIGDWILKMNVR